MAFAWCAAVPGSEQALLPLAPPAEPLLLAPDLVLVAPSVPCFPRKLCSRPGGTAERHADHGRRLPGDITAQEHVTHPGCLPSLKSEQQPSV